MAEIFHGEERSRQSVLHEARKGKRNRDRSRKEAIGDLVQYSRQAAVRRIRGKI